MILCAASYADFQRKKLEAVAARDSRLHFELSTMSYKRLEVKLIEPANSAEASKVAISELRVRVRHVGVRVFQHMLDRALNYTYFIIILEVDGNSCNSSSNPNPDLQPPIHVNSKPDQIPTHAIRP